MGVTTTKPHKLTPLPGAQLCLEMNYPVADLVQPFIRAVEAWDHLTDKLAIITYGPNLAKVEKAIRPVLAGYKLTWIIKGHDGGTRPLCAALDDEVGLVKLGDVLRMASELPGVSRVGVDLEVVRMAYVMNGGDVDWPSTVRGINSWPRVPLDVYPAHVFNNADPEPEPDPDRPGNRLARTAEVTSLLATYLAPPRLVSVRYATQTAVNSPLAQRQGRLDKALATCLCLLFFYGRRGDWTVNSAAEAVQTARKFAPCSWLYPGHLAAPTFCAAMRKRYGSGAGGENEVRR